MILITRFVFILINNFDIFTTYHVTSVISSLNMLWHIVLANNKTTLTNNSRVNFVRHGVVVLVVVIYNIYIIYISDMSLSRFRSDCFLKKIMK